MCHNAEFPSNFPVCVTQRLTVAREDTHLNRNVWPCAVCQVHEGPNEGAKELRPICCRPHVLRKLKVRIDRQTVLGHQAHVIHVSKLTDIICLMVADDG